MVVQANGLRKKLTPDFVLGYTDTETVKLDLDNMSFDRVEYWARATTKRFRLRGFMILKSSKNSYHVVFDKPVSWVKNVAIVAWVCLMTKHRRLTEWLIMQCIKQASTLRIAPKKQKPTPKIVYCRGTRNHGIASYLAYRKIARTVLTKLGTARAKTSL